MTPISVAALKKHLWEVEVYCGMVGLDLRSWLDACRGLSLPFSQAEARCMILYVLGLRNELLA